MSVLHIDFETYSFVDLKVRGLDAYSRDATTGVHCMAYAFDDEAISLWHPGKGHWDKRIVDHIRSGGEVVAHNAAFELALWNNVCVHKYGWPELKPEQMRCTMAQAYAMALPGSLENAASALGLRVRKDAIGKRIMLQLCKPRPDGAMWKYPDDPEKFKKLFAYCMRDVEVERELDERMVRLSPVEQQTWIADQHINQRGVQVDLQSISKATKLVEAEQLRLDMEMLKATGGVVGKCTEVQLLVKWIKAQGVEVPGLAKSDVLDALKGDLPPQVRHVLNLRKEAAKSSTAKMRAMRDRAGPDGRVRGALQYHGASTGRWAGRGIQVQNFPRPRYGVKQKQIEEIITHFDNRDYIDMFHGPVLDALADSLRGMITAGPGKELVAMDFANIESRVLAWLAGAEWKLQVFSDYDAGTGPDIYLVAVSWVYGGDPASLRPHRQEGKAIELGYGFGGGAGAAFTMAKTYGVDLNAMHATVLKIASDEMVEAAERMWDLMKRGYEADQHNAFIAGDILKQFYRARNPEIVRYWFDLEQAAMEAVETPGAIVTCGPDPRSQVAFKVDGMFLWCRLPSGRVLCYPYPEIRGVDTPWGEGKRTLTFMTEVVDQKGAKIIKDEPHAFGKWQRISTYGGSLAENVTQACARDLLRDGILRLEAANLPVVFHAHDEAVVEIPKDAPESVTKEIEHLMAVVPEWAKPMPIAVEGWRGFRYRK